LYKCFFSNNKCRLHDSKRTVAKFIVPDWGDKVDSGIGLSYTGPPFRLQKQAGRYRATLYAGVNNIPPPGTMNLATEEEIE
jgi:hypothetical protein